MTNEFCDDNESHFDFAQCDEGFFVLVDCLIKTVILFFNTNYKIANSM